MRTLILSLLAFVLALPVSAYEKYENPVGDQFPILAWYSIRPEAELTPERYQEMAEAGFNISFSHSGTTEEVAKALKACKGTGVKLMLATWDLPVPEKTAAIVNQFKDDEMIAGWFLRDEPLPSSFKELKEMKDRIRACDNKHLLYLNLLPNYVSPKDLGTSSYEEYIQRFVDEIDLGFFSYDHYPIVVNKNDTILRGNFYGNLEDALSVSQKTGEPFWAFVLSTAHDPYPVATREMMRLEAFSNLAYGAQGIQYFTYWNPGNKGQWNFNTAPISLGGKRTHVWYLVRDLNREIKQLTPVFLGAKAVSVSHTGNKIPDGTKQLSNLPEPFKELQASGSGVLVSQLTNKGKNYLMVVNRDLHHSQDVTVKATKKASRIIAGEKPAKEKNACHTLKPGDYLLYEY